MVNFGYFMTGDFKTRIDSAIRVEKAGFDSFWNDDHMVIWFFDFEFPESWTTLAAIGMKTTKMKIGSAVADPFRRHPALLAQTVATLDVLSNGRAFLGIGAGEPLNLVPYGIAYERPAVRLRESIEVMKKLWRSKPTEPISHEGELFTLKNAWIQVRPLQEPHPPIYVCGIGPVTKRIAGELGDGWFPHIHSAQTYREDVEDVRKGAQKAGRTIESIDTVAWFPLAVSKDYEAARKAIQYPAQTILVLAGDEKLKRLGFQVHVPTEVPGTVTLTTGVISPQTPNSMNEALSVIPPKAVDLTAAFGTPDDCIKRIEEFIQAGAKHIVIWDVSPNHDESLELLQNKIIPYFK